MSAAEWEAWCDASIPGDEPGLGDEDEDDGEPGAEPGVPVLGPAGFGAGGVCDGMPGGLDLALLAGIAAGPGDRYPGASDGELDGLIAAWDRVEAHAAARKHAAIAEFIRRRPAEGCGPAGPGAVPGMRDEFAADELRVLLAENRAAAALMSRAADLAERLPGTMALFRDGWLRCDKAAIVVDGTTGLDPEESRAVEGLVLGRAARLTPGGLRPAVARAVMEVAPGKARKRREDAARDARVERWAEDSGNAALMGRELPPDEVLAADQRITAWAKELARDLLAAAARNPATSWCVTVTDQQGHAAGHGCARPEPKARGKREKPGAAGGARDGPPEPGDPPQGPARPGFSFTPVKDRDRPPGGYGTWRLRVPGNGPDFRVEICSLSTQNCDHRFQAKGHDPGVRLRHLAQVRHAACTGPACRRPAATCDFEHNIPYEAGGPHLPVQLRPQMPARAPAQTAPPVESRPAPRRDGPVDHPVRTELPQRAD